MATPKNAPTATQERPMTLRRFRFMKGFEQSKTFAQACDLNPALVSAMENGSDAYRSAREAVCRVLGISMKQLFRLIDVSRELFRAEEAQEHGEQYP